MENEIQSPARIVIIEQELITRLALTRCLKAENFEVVHTLVPEEIAEQNPACIILGNSGHTAFAITRKLKKIFKKSFPLLIVTSCSDQDEKIYRSFRSCLLWQKPFVCSHLCRYIKRTLAAYYESPKQNKC